MVTTRSTTATMALQPPSSYTHAPSKTTLLWLSISLPLVLWDCGYVLLRPHTMPGGALHYPIWAPYALYGEVDHVYGFKAWDAHNGFTGAQGLLNVVETAMYVVYLAMWWRGKGESGRVVGRTAARAVLIGFSAAVMTLSKTVLYWMCEYYGGFDNIGHNTARDLFVLWIVPNGAWLVFPTYMIWEMGGELVDQLGGSAHSKSE